MNSRAQTFILSFFLLSSSVLFSQGNGSREETRLDEVYNQYALSGEGVVYAMLDRGIDYRHPDFIDSNGETRIAYLFDMVNNTGAQADNNPYGVGTIFTRDDINASLQAGGTPLSTDRGGHGTATTGIAAGNGSGTANLEFQGVAPNATLIVVKLVQDAFPAFDGNQGQSGFYNASYIPIALEFVKDKVAALNMPSVTLMNIGSVGGPTDGTSTICQAIESFIASGHVFVCGVGDDGGAANHASTAIAQGESATLEVNKGQNGNLRFDLWYNEGDVYDVTIERPDGTVLGPFSGPVGPNGADDRSFTGIFYGHRGANTEFYGATSAKRELLIDLSGANGLYKITLTGAQITTDGVFHASLNPSRYSNANDNYFNTYAVEGYSLNDFTSAPSVISPGDYVLDNSWTDINGTFRDITGQGETGEIWAGSSEGPTYDNRLGIDFVAPGEVLFGAYAPNTYYSSFDFNIVQGSNNLYGVQSAVSAAAPLTTGVIALMLELNPDLTPAQIKSILQTTARNDGFTGDVPNNTFGFGKLDAYAAIQEVAQTLNLTSINKKPFDLKIYPNPTTQLVTFQTSQTPEEVIIYSILGKSMLQLKPTDKQFDIDLSSLSTGVYFAKAKINGRFKSQKIIKK